MSARLLVVLCAALSAAGTAAAAGVVGQPSDPPTGTFPASSGEIGYTISVTPNLDGGGIGWCVMSRVFDVGGGSEGGGGCNGVELTNRPIIGWDAGGGGSRHGDVFTRTTDIEFMTTPDVAAVRVSLGMTILTRADTQLPNGDRIAIAVTHSVGHGGPRNGSSPNPFGAVALDSHGQRIGLPVSRSARPLHDITVYWQPGRTNGVGPQPKVHTPPAGACEINTGALHGVDLFFGWVVKHVRGFPDLAGKTYLSCANTQFGYDHAGVIAAILVDAQHPGSPPEVLPDATPVPGHLQTFNEPAAPTPNGVKASGIFAITAKRVGNAWLVVQAGGTVAYRLRVLDELGACVPLTGPPCPSSS